MNQAMLSAVSGAQAALRRLDTITANLANSTTTGFKSLLHLQQGRRASEFGAAMPSLTGDSVKTDFSQGRLETTGDPFHLALAGEGFFVVATPQGERLTRRGAFELDAEGQLVTGEGYRVQGDGGDIGLADAIAIGGQVSVGPDGTIQVGEDELGRVRVATVADLDALQREPGGLFRAAGALQDAEASTYDVHQGRLEAANFSAVENLALLIETMRAFEAYMTSLGKIDGVRQQAIREVARA